ncbi:MAG TPA: cation-translocating P-type ATPase [Thermomicrobiales bacterium]|nr:cation-translocating P-type ATPase [Thermomicrobiales bacterium]
MTAPIELAGKRTIYDVRGMDCAECARSVATAVERLPGVATAQVNFGAGTLTVEAEASSRTDLTPRVLHAVEVAGYRAATRGGAVARPKESVLSNRRAQLAIAAVGLWIAGAIVSVVLDLPAWAVVPYALAVIAGGYTFGRAALMAVRVRRIDMNVLMAVAIVGAMLLGDWAEAAAAAALFAIGNLAQSLTFDRTRSALSSLSTLTPSEALRLVDGREERTPVDLLMPGERVRVRPGERFPLDGVIAEGATTVDESLITGESLPSDKRLGSQVYAGALNGSGSVVVEVTHTAATSTISQIVDLVETARGGRGHAEQTIDRFAALYTPAVVGLAVLLALAGGVVTGDWRDWATRGLVLLVIACPCALIISTPVAIVSAVGVAAKRGFLVKGGAALETIASVRSVVFDKTGTLTRGRPVVTKVMTPDGAESELLRDAAAVEALSEHPLGLAVLDHAARSGVSIPAATDFRSIPGRGAMAVIEQRTVWIGSPAWFDELGISYAGEELGRTVQSETILLVASGFPESPVYRGAIALADQLRPESPAVVETLRRLAIAPIAMMTGDNRATAQSVARRCGIDTVYAELLPGDKSRLVAELREQTGGVAMVGDGVNDGPALGSATVGFAMGLTGSDLAVETADVAILRNDLFAIPGAIELSRKTVGIIRQNIGISLSIKAIALVLTLLGVVSLWMAVAFDLGTSLLVTANALRLTRWQLPGSGHQHAPVAQSATGVATGVPTADA